MTSGTDLAVGDLMAQTNKHEREARAGARSTANQQKKKDDHTGEGYKVVMPPEKFIPLSVSDIIDSMRTSIRHEDRAAFTEICQLVEGCATTEFSGLRRRVKKNYRFFSQAAMHRDVPTRVGRGIKKEATMDDMELVFLNDVWELMNLAHYKCMTEADWLAVKQERLMLDMPLQVDWDKLDTRMLKNFFERHPEHKEGLFRFCEHALMFHRGVGVLRMKELFIVQKVDLLMNYLVAWPSKQVFYKIAPKLWKSAQDYAEKLKKKDREQEMSPTEVHTQEEREEREHMHVHAQELTRVSLRTMMPTWRSVFSKMFKQVEVVEPTYKDIVMIYRKHVDPPSEKELKKKPKLSEEFRRNRRGIFVKRFDEVPVADIEIVFPEKEIGLKLIDKLIIGLTALSALIGGIVMLIQGALSWSLIMSMGSTVGGKLYQTYATAQRKKADLQKQMSQKVFDVSMDAQEGALYSVLDEMSDQIIKEQLLAYFLLLKNKYPATEEELDDLCENFLDARFEVKIDFAIEDSLPRLLTDGLVTHAVDDDDPRLVAVSIDTAHERLIQKWQKAFTYDAEAEGGSIAGAISQPFSAAGSAVSGMGKLVTKAVHVIPGASALPGIKPKSPKEGEVAGPQKKKKKKRSKLKDLFKSKHKDE